MKRFVAFTVGAFLLLFVFCPQTWPAAAPPTAPILRIESGMHTARIRRIGVDAAPLLATVSYDGYIRLYEISAQGEQSLRLIAKEKARSGQEPLCRGNVW